MFNFISDLLKEGLLWIFFLLITPIAIDILETLVISLVSFVLRIFRIRVPPYRLKSYFTRLFFLGYLITKFILFFFASIFDIELYNLSILNSDKIRQITTARTDSTFKVTIFALAPYITILLGILLFLQADILINVLIFTGLQFTSAYFLLYYLIISIFYSGRPHTTQIIQPILQFVQNRGSAFFMVSAIFFSSMFLVNNIGYFIVIAVGIIQIITLISIEFIVIKNQKRNSSIFERNNKNYSLPPSHKIPKKATSEVELIGSEI